MTHEVLAKQPFQRSFKQWSRPHFLQSVPTAHRLPYRQPSPSFMGFITRLHVGSAKGRLTPESRNAATAENFFPLRLIRTGWPAAWVWS